MGIFAALGTALCWAIAARLFRGSGQVFSPLAMNFWKGLISVVLLLGVTLWLSPAQSVSTDTLLWLLLSGVIGIGIGDTLFFKALTSIGDSQAVLVAETLAPIFTALLAMAWIAEWITWQQWLGVGMILFSVDMVIKSNKRSATHIVASSGYLFGVGAAICQAIGAVISRDILVGGDIDAASAAMYRLIGGLVLVALLIVATRTRLLPRQGDVVAPSAGKLWPTFVIATLLGTTAAIFLQMLAFAHAKAAVVQTLIATSAIMSLGVAWIMGERFTWRVLIWSLAALLGVAVLVSTGNGATH
ncbi:DMT family transporter [Alteromonas sp. ASW11-19]|uniref:DMT family transporter n=1 Tax=Alteromonas salexigens TaxID=2982530 RepID=A0ABT2VRV1_9ALTE|nr:DMT family transporter [Alteromonas salexigens]MCU7554639.1 DMT family transporter [Alteromonas salexigens]